MLNRRSDQAAASLLSRLSEAQRPGFVAAMGVVERLLLAGAVRLNLGNPRSGSAPARLPGGKRNTERRVQARLQAPGELLPVTPETGPGAPAPRVLHAET